MKLSEKNGKTRIKKAKRTRIDKLFNIHRIW